MLISVCIPTHNRKAMLSKALSSALDQGCSDYEVIVSDNASIDGSADMVAGIVDSRVTLLRQLTNIGSVANHNECVRAASGTWILFLHDDDLLRPKALGMVLDFLRKHDACEIVLPGYMRSLLDGELFDNCLRLLNGISMSSTLFRRDLLLQVPFETDNPCCDWEVLFVSALRGLRICTYPFDFIARGHHPGQEGALVARDGRGLLGKSNAVRRLCLQLTDADWDALCRRIAITWTAPELMELARFVRIAGFHARFHTLKSCSRHKRKWRWSSRQGVAIAVERLFGPRATSRLLMPWRAWIQNRAARRS